jgi:hypothetical protein
MFCSLGFMVIDTVGTPLEGKVLVYPFSYDYIVHNPPENGRQDKMF